MGANTSVQERLRRARSESMDSEVTSLDPLVVDVTNDDSGNSYMVVPDAGKCSCPDHQHRDVVCKHMLFLAVQDADTVSAEAVRGHITDRMLELQDEKEGLEAELEQVESELQAYQSVHESVDGVGDDQDDVEDDPFRSMVDDLQE